MNSYCVENTKQTTGMITTGLIAAALLFNHQIFPVGNHKEVDLLQRAYISSAPSPTCDQYRNAITYEFISDEDPLVAMMSVLYENLLTEQEILDADFRKVLTENLWDLYES